MYRSTREAAELLGMRPGSLSRACWEGRVETPARGPSGAFLWEETDIRKAAWALLHRDLDEVLAERAGTERASGGD